MHEGMKEEIAKYFHEIRFVSLTADAWTSENGLGLLGVTAHWVDGTWQYRETVLALRELLEKHDGEGMATILYEIIVDFKLMSKVVPFFHLDDYFICLK